MFVGSLPEMHLMSYGWMLYNNMWALLTFIGITTFPFIWIMFTSVVDAVKKHGFHVPEASNAAWFTVAPTLLLMMGVYALAVVPRVPLNIDTWEYSQLCTTASGALQETEMMTPGNTGTPLDQARALTQANMRASDVRVPILWDLIMRIGAGMSRAMNSAGACPTNTTYLDKTLRQMSIKDPDLQAELGQFAKDCYFPARAKFNQAMQRANLDTVPTIHDAQNQDQYVAAAYREWRSARPANADQTELFARNIDPGYIGSRFFLTTPGLYAPVTPGQFSIQGDQLQASTPIAGWPYDPIRDCVRTSARDDDGNPWCTSPHHPSRINNHGSPTCDEWWTDPDRGLLHRLRQNAEDSVRFNLSLNGQATTASEALRTVIASVNPADAKSDQWLADKMVATALANDLNAQQSIWDKLKGAYLNIANTFSSPDSGVLESAPGTTSLSSWLVGGFAALRTAVAAKAALFSVSASLASTAAEFYATAWIVKQAYPVIQAYLMFFFIALTPVVMLASLYDIARLFQLVLLFLGIMFLSPWRYVVEYLDERLFEIMFPDQWANLGTDVLLHTKERLIIDVTTTLMYTLFPVILMWLVALMGADGAKAIGGMMNADRLSGFGKSMGRWGGGKGKKGEKE